MLGNHHRQLVAAVQEKVQQAFGQTLDEFLAARDWESHRDVARAVVAETLTKEQTAYLKARLGVLEPNLNIFNYACELVLNWVLQDVVREVICRNGEFPCEFAGDPAREFEVNPLVSYDLSVEVLPDHPVLLKVVTDFDDAWQERQRIHLRSGLYDALKRENGTFLGIAPLAGHYFLAPVRDTAPEMIRHFKPFGYKPVAFIPLTGIRFHPLKTLAEVVISYLRRLRNLWGLIFGDNA